MKIKNVLPADYFVVDENMLVFVFRHQPTVASILASSVIRGALLGWKDGTTYWPRSNHRPATQADFDTFKVSSKGHLN